MIYFNKIELQNFGSYKQQTFNFKPGQTLISGENGTGKSTVFEAIAYGIYKYSNRNKNVSYNKNGDCFVKLYFSINNINYIIERYYQHPIYKNDLKLFCDEKNISDDLVKNTEDQILRLGFPEQEFFIMTITVLQGIPINFLQLAPTKRKEILEMLFNFNIWDIFRKKVEKYDKKNKNILLELSSNFTKLKEKQIHISTKIETINNINEQRINSINEQIKQIKKNMIIYSNKINELKNNETDLQNSKNDVDSYSDKISTLNSLLNQKTQIITNSICPTCKRPYDLNIDTAIIKNEINQLKEKIIIVNTTLNNYKNKYNIVKKENDTLNENKNNLDNCKMNLSKQINEKNKIVEQENTDELKIKLKEIENIMTIETEKINIINQKLRHTLYIDKMLLPSSEFRTQIMEKYIIHVNECISEIGKYIFPQLNIKLFVNKSNGIDTCLDKQEFNDFNYNQLSGGEKKRLDVIIILALQRFLIQNNKISTNLLVFDEIFDSLDLNGINSILECINNIYDNNMCIYVISHINSIKNSFDNIVNIIKEDGVSKINEQETI